MTPKALERKIKRRMKRINVDHRSYFIRNENNIRLCYVSQGHYRYITIPFCDCDAMTLAATLLKQCGIVDGYKVQESDSNFYVVLIQYKYRKHVDSIGRVMNVLESKAVEWSDLSLTRDDVKQFIARFEFSAYEMPTSPRTPAIPMYAYKTGVIKMPSYSLTKIA